MSFIDSIPLLLATIISVQLSLIDIKELRIPNRILLPGTLISALAIFAIGLLTGQIARSFLAFLSGVLSVIVFFCIHLLRPSGLGMGDVKFAGLIGMTLAWISFPTGLIGLGLAFNFSSLFSLIVFVAKRKSFQRVIPFAPFMLLGLLFVEFGLLI